MQVHTVKNNRRTANCKCSPFLKKNLIIRIFCISGWLTVTINPDQWSFTVILLCNVITDPNYYLFLLLFLLGTVSLGFFALYSNNGIHVVGGSVWLVRTVESKAYLREYNVIGAKWCIYR